MTSPITTAVDRTKEANEAIFRTCNESLSIKHSNVEHDNDSEPENVVWPPKDHGLDHEIGYKSGHDAHTSGDQSLEESGRLSGNPGCLNIPDSHKTIQDNAEAPGEANAADVTANQVKQEARRRGTNPEQPSPPNIHLNDGSMLSFEERHLQTIRDGLTTLHLELELEKLKANGEAAEENIKIYDERISANRKQLVQVLQSVPLEDLVANMAPFYSDLVTLDRKRKIEEGCKMDTDRKKAKLVAQFNATINPTDS